VAVGEQSDRPECFARAHETHNELAAFGAGLRNPHSPGDQRMTALRGRPLGEKRGVFCQASHLTEPSDVGERLGRQPPEKLGPGKLLGDDGGKWNGHCP